MSGDRVFDPAMLARAPRWKMLLVRIFGKRYVSYDWAGAGDDSMVMVEMRYWRGRYYVVKREERRAS